MVGHALVVALEGPSGAGKSRVSAELSRRFGWALLAEAYDRLDRKLDLSFSTESDLLRLERALLREEGLRFAVAQSLVSRRTPVVADTGFLGPVSYTAGLLTLGRCRPATYHTVLRQARSMAAHGHLGLPDLTVHLTVSSATRAERTRGDPRGHPEALRERHETVGRFESGPFRAWLRLRRPRRNVLVRASGPPEAVARAVVRVASGVRRLTDPSVSAVELLDRLAGQPPAANPRHPRA